MYRKVQVSSGSQLPSPVDVAAEESRKIAVSPSSFTPMKTTTGSSLEGSDRNC